jgi:uncharacterized cupredoxin-like copper-binding protein
VGIAVHVALVVAFAQTASGHEAEPSASGHEAHATPRQTAFGIAGNRRDVRRTIEIRMRDEMRFVPANLDVRQGETVRLKLANDGKLLHELVIGTRKELDAHAAMMMDSGMTHGEPYVAHVAPGQTGEIIWKFNRAGRFDFACLVAGHYQAGMVGTINVTSR